MNSVDCEPQHLCTFDIIKWFVSFVKKRKVVSFVLLFIQIIVIAFRWCLVCIYMNWRTRNVRCFWITINTRTLTPIERCERPTNTWFFFFFFFFHKSEISFLSMCTDSTFLIDSFVNRNQNHKSFSFKFFMIILGLLCFYVSLKGMRLPCGYLTSK